MLEYADSVLLESRIELRRMVSGYCSRPHLPVYFDTETTGFDPYTCKLVTLQLKQEGYAPIVIDVRQRTPHQLKEIGAELLPIFRTSTIVGMNIIFDWIWLFTHCGVAIQNLYDVMIAEQIIRGLGMSDAAKQGVHFNLQAIAEKYGIAVEKETRSIFPGMDTRLDEWNAPFSDHVVRYMAQDVEVLEPIYKAQKEKLKKLRIDNVMDLEMRALPALAMMELNGISINAKEWTAFIQECQEKATKLENQAAEYLNEYKARREREKFRNRRIERELFDKELAEEIERLHALHAAEHADVAWGSFKRTALKAWKERHKNPGVPHLDESPINLGSSSQVLPCLQEMGVMIEQTWFDRDAKKWVTEEKLIDKTDADTLKKVEEGKYPAVDLLLEWRKYDKFVNSFGETLLNKINPVTGRIHPHYVQIGASTGRMSCTNPNWQQVPSKGLGKKLRSLVVAKPGKVLLTADFSNIELRIVADYSRDANMLKFFAEGKDLHAETARMMFNLPEHLSAEQIKDLKSPEGYKYRDAAKTINFGLIYGMSAKKLASQLKIAVQAADKLMKAYFALYPGVAEWLEETRKTGVRLCKSRTMSGRLRMYTLPASDDPDYRRLRASVERKACNTPVQGTSADITKLALALLYAACPDYLQIVAVVHDEIVCEVNKRYAEECAGIVGAAMDQACDRFLKGVTVPLTVVNISEQWEKA